MITHQHLLLKTLNVAMRSIFAQHYLTELCNILLTESREEMIANLGEDKMFNQSIVRIYDNFRDAYSSLSTQ